MQSHWRPTLAIAALAFVSVTWTALAQTGRTVADGVYTDPQATRGQAVYARECQACHGTTLSGGLGPPLAGVGFLQAWDTLSLADLVDKIQKTMPATDPGTLSRAEATDVVAYVLKASKFPAGPAELSSDPATLTNLALGGPRDGAPAQTLPSGRPPGNLAQVMRGILFPSSNLIFNVQNQDPGEEKVGWSPGTTSFAWVDWGAGIYSGWELVDYAAIAIAESAPLLLLPGRRCENGRPVPVEQPDWVQFTEAMADAGRAAYRASQSRNQEAVSEVTNQIADACLQCHDVYRDKPGGTTIDPSNKAARCVP